MQDRNLLSIVQEDGYVRTELTRSVALVPYYIDFVGRYKLSSQRTPKLQNAGQEASQKKKAEMKLYRMSSRVINAGCLLLGLYMGRLKLFNFDKGIKLLVASVS